MVLRAPGEVGCSHCKTIGATTSCPVCKRLVCDPCAADWATCDEPSGRIVRLGLTARVRDVDPLGRFALISHWRQPLRLFDLRRLCWISDVQLSRWMLLAARAFPPRLTSDGHVIYAGVGLHGVATKTQSLSDRLLDTIYARPLAGGEPVALAHEPPLHGTAVSAVHDCFWYVSERQHVAVVARAQKAAMPAPSSAIALSDAPPPVPPTRVVSVEPLPRKVVQAAYVDAERDLLAAASWGELVLHRLRDGELVRLGRATPQTSGNVTWIAVAGSWLAVTAHAAGGGTNVEVRRLESDLSIGDVVYHHHLGARLTAAALSRDGRFLAVGYGDRLLVHSLDDDRVTVFDEHTDTINVVRFASDDHLLISADTDNRVVLRPRTQNGYAKPVLQVTPGPPQPLGA